MLAMASSNVPDPFDTRLQLEIIPISSLKSKSRLMLSTYLNNKKVLRSESMYERDWRGLFDLARIPKPYFQAVETSSDPMKELLDRWQEDGENATFQSLHKFLIEIDRIDCLDDCKEYFGRHFQMSNIIRKIFKEFGFL